jgi:hypothetical protein
VDQPLCELWRLHEPDIIAPWRESDQVRYDHGLPWNGKLDIPHGLTAFIHLLSPRSHPA